MSSAQAPRTIADQLRSWSDERLSSLLEARPDLLSPMPQDSAQLASRAASAASLQRALDRLDTRELAVAATLVAAGPCSLDELADSCSAEREVVAPVVRRLLELVLAWEAPDGLRPLTGVAARLRGQPLPMSEPPELVSSRRDADLVERTAAGAAFEAVRRMELLLDHWSSRPPTALRSGGLGIRELKAVATLLHTEPAEAALLIEAASSGGLLAPGRVEGEQVWLPTDEYDVWVELPIAQRWVRLVVAWLDSQRLPALAGTKDAVTGRARNALGPELVAGTAVETRRLALEALSSLPVGEALATGTGVASLVARVAWQRPRRLHDPRDLVAWSLREAAAWGITGMDAVTEAGRALLSGDLARAAAALAPLLPEPVDRVLIQNDLTAVAPGPLVTERARSLHVIAEVESRGGATVYRFTRDSLRRAFDAGWSATEVHDFLAELSATPVPQPLSYLVGDVERSFGTLRVGRADAYIRSDDEAALTELLHLRQAASLGLRRLAPTVLISTAPIDVLLPRLRELGASPVVEAPDGTVRVARPEALRAGNPQPRRPPAADRARDAARTRAVVAAVRAGDRAAADRPAGTPTTAGGVLALLRDAVECRTPVVIGFVDAYGAAGERTVDPLAVEAGVLTAHDRQADDTRTFPLSRITGVRSSAP